MVDKNTGAGRIVEFKFQLLLSWRLCISPFLFGPVIIKLYVACESFVPAAAHGNRAEQLIYIFNKSKQ